MQAVRWLRRRQRTRDDDDEYEYEEQLQMAKARSLASRQRRQARPTTWERATTPLSSAAAPSQPEAERCIICLEDFDGEPRGRPDAQVSMRGWGYTPCCGGSSHFECLSTWMLDTDMVESTSEPVPLPTSCPQCRSTRMAATSSRMLQGKRPEWLKMPSSSCDSCDS